MAQWGDCFQMSDISVQQEQSSSGSVSPSVKRARHLQKGKQDWGGILVQNAGLTVVPPKALRGLALDRQP